MQRLGIAFALCLGGGLAWADSAECRDQAPEPVNLFFDCPTGGCGDLDYLRREVPFVSWVLDRADADVHVLVTSQTTGGGGRAFTVAFIGLRRFVGDDQEMTYATNADATQDEQRSRLADRLRLGLVRYVQGTPAVDDIHVVYGGEADPPVGEDGPAAASPMVPAGRPSDSWDYWVFRLNGSANANGEATSKFSNTQLRFSANRTTDAWKVDLSANYFRRLQEFEFSSGGTQQTIQEIQNDWGASALAVRSIGAHWALGIRANAASSTSRNQDLRVFLRPGLEFSVFPYTESSRRSLTFQYLIGPEHSRYAERTIFDQTIETRMQEALTAAVELVQPWGRWSTSATATHYLHDMGKSNLALNANFNVRIFRGFSITVGANYQWLRDQLYLSAAGATPEQVLLRQRQLETGYFYFYNVGIEYRFGSIFNNVVNPRFGG